jgi:hypothetical protein
LLTGMFMIRSVRGEERCPSGEHASGGHCCPAGSEWVPALARCVNVGAGNCPSGEHESGGHCCPAGAEWVPAIGQCVTITATPVGSPPAQPSGPTPPAQRFSKSEPYEGEPIIIDTKTRLIWQGIDQEEREYERHCFRSKCLTKVVPFQQAKTSCEQSFWAGMSGWRLPTYPEFQSIFDAIRQEWDTKQVLFDMSPQYSRNYWTTTLFTEARCLPDCISIVKLERAYGKSRIEVAGGMIDLTHSNFRCVKNNQ